MAESLTHNQTFKTPQEALLHYGVKGMKWGVTSKGKSGGDRAAVRAEQKKEKRDTKVASLTSRAAKADIRVKEIQSELAAIKPGFKTSYKRSNIQNELNQAIAYRDHLNKTAERVEAGKMTPNQRNLIIGGALVGGVLLASYGASKMQSGEFNALKLRGEAALRGKPFDFKKNDDFAGKMSADDVLSKVVPGINPNYKRPGGQMNCRRCTFAYELRRRGHDVEATASSLGYGQSETGLLNALSPGGKNVSRSTSLSQMVVGGAKGIRTQVSGDSRKSVADTFSVANAKDRKSLFDTFKQQPDGARGEAVFNFGKFGHSLAYERFGDKTYIFDTQKGKRYDVGDDHEYGAFLKKWGEPRVKDVQITRLDNLDLDKEFLARWATNRKQKG